MYKLIQINERYIYQDTKLTSKRTDVSTRAPGEHKYEQEEPRKTHKRMKKYIPIERSEQGESKSA